MKKLCLSILALVLTLSLAACTQSPISTEPSTEPAPSVTDPTVTEPTPTIPAEPPKQAPMYSISLPIIQETSEHTDGAALFTLTYQDMSLILPDPDVAEKIIVHYLNITDAVIKDAQSIQAAASDAYHGQTDWQPYSCSNLYDVTRIDSNVLSLHGTYSSFSGAAHPTHLTQSANYDLMTGNALVLDGILSDGANIDQVYQLLIVQLSAIREEKQLYPDYADVVKDILGFGDFDNWYFSEEGLCFCFSPYDIAPYASGTIEATIPYTQLQGILNDAYFPMEWAYEGNLSADSLDDTDMDRFTQISELALHADGVKFVLHSAETAVSNVVVEYGAVSRENHDRFISQSTVFACASITPGDAVVMNVAFSDVSPVLRICYQSGNARIVKYVFQSGEDGSIDLIDP